MIVEILNSEDKERLKSISKSEKLFNFTTIFPIISFCIVGFLLWKMNEQTLFQNLGFLAVIIATNIYQYFKNRNLQNNEKYKLTGKSIITKKYYDGDVYRYTFSLEDNRVREIDVSENQYRNFKVGDSIYIEVAQKTKEILILEKVESAIV